MGFRLLANFVVLLHAAFLLFVVAGALLVARWPRLLPVHLACVAWGAYVELAGKICPLTPLENHFRGLAGLAGYSGGFIEQYLIPALYPARLTASVQTAIGLGVLALNGALYALLWKRMRSH
ncbi:MAG TPA: DUF2784 domain-containing protein [Gemmatimonadales bacterium]|jgi:hypothetical protein